jgi:hypothetical protein
MTSGAPAPVDGLPTPALLIGDRQITDAGGGTFEHIYILDGPVDRTALDISRAQS